MSASKGNGKGNKKVGAVMVVGAGIGGMEASLDLADAGFKVYLTEETSSIGGRMAQLDKTFPTNDCSMCTISPKLIDVGKHINIEILTNTQVSGISGEPGNYTVDLHQKARYVDMVKCNACGDCIAVCPVSLPSEFDEETMDRRAIHKRYPQAIPGEVAISKANRPPCVITCLADTRPQAYLALVAEGRFEDAYRVIKRGNPFPAVCGRVCHHPCEVNCNRNEIDEPVAINPVKRFVSDWARKQIEDGNDFAKVEKAEIDPEKAGQKICIVGGGPAGLTVARDLALNGYPVTLLEAEDDLGGMMNYGIPRYRLPQEEIAKDIKDITDLGFEVKMGTALGRDVKLDDLKKDYKAIFLGIGAQGSAKLPPAIEGQNHDGVLFAMDFLRECNKDNPPKIGKNVLVIGGGNVAIDVIMTAKRLGAENLKLACLECEEEMPAHSWEIADAVEEGVELACEWGPDKIVADENGKVKGVELTRCTCVFDLDKRFNPQFDNDCKTFFEADTVIIAIGQVTQSEFVTEGADCKTQRGKIVVDPLTLQSDDPMIFSGGDCVTIPASVMEAIGAAHRAAESIDRYLQGKDLKEGRTLDKEEPAGVPDYKTWQTLERQQENKIPLTDRGKDFREITQALTEEQAIAEAKRCMNCGLCCECEMCVEACQPKAIIHDDVDKDFQVNVGSLVLTPGFEKFDPKLRDEYGHGRYENVITSLEFERILSASGPFQGHVKRPGDHKEPKKMAWIQCVGSRDPQCGNDYCSSVCCMYAIKEALMAVDHVPGLEATVFYNDIRAYGKGFEQYFENSKSAYGVQYKRGIISTVKEKQQTKNLLITYVAEDGTITEEEYDMVVLSIGLRPSASSSKLAKTLSLKLNRFGFCEGEGFDLEKTNQEGIFVAGAFAAPMDIPETVMTAATAVAKSTEYLKEARHSLVSKKEYPEERNTTKEEPRIGVFICRCGTNIARAVEVPTVVEYAKDLPYVVHAEENLYTCSSDTQKKITDTIGEYNLNRVVVASCTPRTHEPLFQDTLREAGLNKYLFEMANIRDQCSWVHSEDRDVASAKAEDLVRMAVARAGKLASLEERDFAVDQRGLVVGGGIAGITAALTIAGNGFECTLVERETKLGGLAASIKSTLNGINPEKYVSERINDVINNPMITVMTETEVVETGGHVGKFVTKVKKKSGEEIDLAHGALVLATGGKEYKPTEYGFGDSNDVITQLGLEDLIYSDAERIKGLKQVVMIQCVGSREKEHPYCSRVCCQESVKNAIALKELNQEMNVIVLFRDMRTYGFNELAYQKARDMGVLFVRFDPEHKPEVSANGKIVVKINDDVTGLALNLTPDLLVLSAGIQPQDDRKNLSSQFKTPLNADGFYLEAHMKLRPLDFPNDGMFLAGIAHAPKTISETIAQAKGAAARVATVLSKERMMIPATVSRVDPDRCAACLTCLRMCPYQVPKVGADMVAFIEPALCQGCGVCASVCPRKAIELQHYKDDQLIAKVDTLFDDAEFDMGKDEDKTAAE